MWLERRLGVLGQGRSFILAHVRAPLTRGAIGRLSSGDAPVELPVGLDVHFPTRGGAERVRRILRFGAALGEIAGGPHETATIHEAALFNLAVALFDTIIDEQPWRTAALLRALTPECIVRCIHTGATIPRGEDSAVACVVELFERVARSLHRRRLSATSIAELERLLTRMYCGETGTTGSDPFDAKLLPTVFIGRLGDRDRSTATLFESVSSFLALWDDWQDIADDAIHHRPNMFLGRGRAGVAFGTIWRVLAPTRSREDVARRLRESLDRVLCDAQHAGRRCAVEALLRSLVGP